MITIEFVSDSNSKLANEKIYFKTNTAIIENAIGDIILYITNLRIVDTNIHIP